MAMKMLKRLKNITRKLASKLIVIVGLTLLITLSIWAYFNIDYQEKKMMGNIISGTDRLTNTIRLGTHYAMMLNSRDDINQIINNIGRQKEIETIRIYNKNGEIKFSNRTSEIDTATNIKDEACYICHRTDPPLAELDLTERIRIADSPQGYRLLGIISPIVNEPGCATDACHIHPEGKKILGALDVIVSLQDTDSEILLLKRRMIGLAGFVFLVPSAIIFIFVLKFVNQPIRKLIDGTRKIANGVYHGRIHVDQNDEMGQLALAINQMSDEISKKQTELNEQKDEYQTLFERVPCLITVNDREYKLLRYNQEFADMFNPQPGDCCYHAYKGRDEKCPDCLVEQTFKDGLSHHGEEVGVNKDGSVAHWFVRTTPIKNAKGEIIAAMEISLDITERMQLEGKLKESERKYHEIFNNIPNPLFVLDMESLEILDCNESVKSVYNYNNDEILNRSFMSFFEENDRDQYASILQTSSELNRVKHLSKEGKTLFVNIRVSPSNYADRKVLLVTTSDITERLETEQQLIQAGKMATLGEMATGIAHELNQPLSVIKTSSSFFIKKIDKKERIEDEILENILLKIDNNVDRASRIINHMRQFARKSEKDFEKVQINAVLQNAADIFSQQLKVRGIEIVWNIDESLPKIHADPSRLEQVVINLLLNARDAIEEESGIRDPKISEKRITLTTKKDKQNVICEVCDTGKGIAEIMRDKVFEPFFTTKEVGQGTGLGLSISYGIIKDHGGSIQVVPNKPKGACFIMKFPIPKKNDEKTNITR
jgi:histidine kinase